MINAVYYSVDQKHLLMIFGFDEKSTDVDKGQSLMKKKFKSKYFKLQCFLGNHFWTIYQIKKIK